MVDIWCVMTYLRSNVFRILSMRWTCQLDATYFINIWIGSLKRASLQLEGSAREHEEFLVYRN